MSTLHASDLRRLNKIFDTPDFGRTPDGRLRFRWFHTTELHYFVEGAKEEPQRLTTRKYENGKRAKDLTLWLVLNGWERHCWANRLNSGDGRGYVIAVWKPPLSRDMHVARYGDKAPYQTGGEYHLIENTFRKEDDPPTERHTELLKQLLLQMFHLGVDPERHPMHGNPQGPNPILDGMIAQMEKRHKATRDEIMDELEDIYPAFGKMPGKRGGGVSIGGYTPNEQADSGSRIIIPSTF